MMVASKLDEEILGVYSGGVVIDNKDRIKVLDFSEENSLKISKKPGLDLKIILKNKTKLHQSLQENPQKSLNK